MMKTDMNPLAKVFVLDNGAVSIYGNKEFYLNLSEQLRILADADDFSECRLGWDVPDVHAAGFSGYSQSGSAPDVGLMVAQDAELASVDEAFIQELLRHGD